MNIRNTFKTSIRGLTTHKSRSVLTILGIVIGITAIMLVMAVSRGAKDLILSQIHYVWVAFLLLIHQVFPSCLYQYF